MTQSRQAVREESALNEHRCRNCGSFVTPEFARVFGNNDDEVFGCLDCMSATAVKNGKARAETVETSDSSRGTTP